MNSPVYIYERKTPLYRKIRWENVMPLLLIILTICAVLIWAARAERAYEIEYVSYVLQKNDSLFNLVQDQNSYYPKGWDARDYVDLAMTKNQIVDVSQIRAGEEILIPIVRPK